MSCPATALPNGSARQCVNGNCRAACTTAGDQVCTLDNGQRNCIPMVWDFEAFPYLWFPSGETSADGSMDQHHTGLGSLSLSASSDKTLPASADAAICVTVDGSIVGTMDARGKTFSAWIFVPDSPSSLANTRCRLRALDRNYAESALIGSSVAIAPIPTGTWFQLKGTFPDGDLESRIFELFVDCFLPADWMLANWPAQAWYVDDIRVD